jgi:hypothetical protein
MLCWKNIADLVQNTCYFLISNGEKLAYKNSSGSQESKLCLE